ncbi:MAG: hypothetical protein ACREP7_21285 [Lysobacter sp.]
MAEPNKIRVHLFFLLLAFSIALGSTAHAGNGQSPGATTASNARTIDVSRIHGRIQIVTAFADYKVQVVQAFPDLRVQTVTAFPDSAGKWQRVESFPDYKIQLVDAFPDFKIQYVDSFPGVP